MSKSESGLQRGHLNLKSPFQSFYRVLLGLPLPLLLNFGLLSTWSTLLTSANKKKKTLLTSISAGLLLTWSNPQFISPSFPQTVDSYFDLPDYFLFPTNNFKEVHVINSFNFMFHDQEVFAFFNFMKGWYYLVLLSAKQTYDQNLRGPLRMCSIGKKRL